MKNNHTKEEMKLYGVYIIKNNITQDIYIGSTIESFNKRLSKHLSDYKKGILKEKRLTCPILYNSFLKYDLENFEFFILKKFKNKKDNKRTKAIITYLEEKAIIKYNPKYNICKKPTLSGCPNLGRKLTINWKLKIKQKSAIYKHSLNTLEKVIENNKNNSSQYNVCLEEDCFQGTLQEAAAYFNLDVSTLYYKYKGKHNIKNKYIITKLKNQKKKIKIIINNDFIIFSSFAECDRYFNMWRGYTSTQIVNNKKQILDFNYELINDDIV